MKKQVKRRYGEVRGVSEEDRTAEFIISTATRDRHKTVLNPEGWDLDNYRKNPIVAYDHEAYGGGLFTGHDPDNIIGTSEVFMEDGNLIGRVTFEPEEVNPKAEKIFRKVQIGTFRSTSVGFYPVGKGKYGTKEEARGKDNETFYYEGQELLEWSIVPLPSNPDAVKNAVPEDKAELLTYILTEALGDEFNESLTLKGVFNILNGEDVEEMAEEQGIKTPSDVKKQINDFRKISRIDLIK